MDPSYPHVGTGWAFPPVWDDDRAPGLVSLSHGEDDIREAIELILGTDPGERRMRPEFGAGVSRYVFAPRTKDTCARLAFAVERALLRWEPRIIVLSVDATPAGSAEDRIDVRVDYRIDLHRRPTSLIVPFYLEGAT